MKSCAHLMPSCLGAGGGSTLGWGAPGRNSWRAEAAVLLPVAIDLSPPKRRLFGTPRLIGTHASCRQPYAADAPFIVQRRSMRMCVRAGGWGGQAPHTKLSSAQASALTLAHVRAPPPPTHTHCAPSAPLNSPPTPHHRAQAAPPRGGFYAQAQKPPRHSRRGENGQLNGPCPDSVECHFPTSDGRPSASPDVLSRFWLRAWRGEMMMMSGGGSDGGPGIWSARRPPARHQLLPFFWVAVPPKCSARPPPLSWPGASAV